MIRKSFTKLKRIIFSGLVMSLCTFVFNPTTPANAAVVQESEPNDDWTTADNLSLNTWVKGTMRRKADDRYYRDKDYYKFTISQTGETSIEVNFPPLISANRNQWGPLGASFMHSRKVLPKQNGSRLRDYSRGYLRFCSSPCFHLGMPSKSQTVLKAAAGAGTHRKITVILSHTFKMDMPDLILGREVLPLVSFRFPVQAHPYDLLLYLKQLLRLPVCGPPSG